MKLFHQTSDTRNEVDAVQTTWIDDFKIRVETSSYKAGSYTQVCTRFFNGREWVTVLDWKKLSYEYDIDALHRVWAEKTLEFLRPT